MALRYLLQIWIYKSKWCQDHDGSETLCYLQANKLVCRHFMDAGSKHEILGSETKDSLLHTAIVVSMYDHFLWWFPNLNSHRNMQQSKAK